MGYTGRMNLTLGVSTFIDVYCLMIIVSCVMSFFPNGGRGNAISDALDRVTDPVLKPIRMIMPPMAGLDLSPMVALFLLRGLQHVAVMTLSGM